MAARRTSGWGIASLLWAWVCVLALAGVSVRFGARSMAALREAQRLEALGAEITYAHETFGLHADPLRYRAMRGISQWLGVRIPSVIHQAHFPDRSLDDAALHQLARVESLRVLRCGFDEVSPTGLKDLARLRNLRYLSLVAPAVTLEDLRPLRSLPNLRTLILKEAQLSDADREELHRWFERTNVQVATTTPGGSERA